MSLYMQILYRKPCTILPRLEVGCGIDAVKVAIFPVRHADVFPNQIALRRNGDLAEMSYE